MGNELDLPRLKTLNKYWRKYPPVHVLFAAYVGYKEPEVIENTKKMSASQEAQMAEFMANVPSYKFNPPTVKNNEH